MDIMSNLRADVFRSVVTIIIPGATATSPFVGVLVFRFPRLGLWLHENPTVSGVLLLLVATAAGQILETLGAWIESGLWDQRLRKKNPTHLEEWRVYLRLAFKVEPIGQQYLRTLTLGLKFELNFGLGLLLFIVGIIWCNCLTKFLSCGEMTAVAIVILVLGVYLLWESKDSCKLLADVRHEILKGVNVVGDSHTTKDK